MVIEAQKPRKGSLLHNSLSSHCPETQLPRGFSTVLFHKHIYSCNVFLHTIVPETWEIVGFRALPGKTSLSFLRLLAN